MVRKRKRRSDRANGSPSGPPKPSPDTAGTHCETKKPPILTDAFKGAFDQAIDRAKSELVSKGKIGPMVFFMYEDGTIKAMTLTLRGAQQQEALTTRIREKVLAENVLAVITLTQSGRGQQEMVLSGATAGASASARVEYSFDKETKAVTSWKIIRLDKPARNVFLHGIFGRT
jgi:hypothetical protein